jgi:hypothetical protein
MPGRLARAASSLPQTPMSVTLLTIQNGHEDVPKAETTHTTAYDTLKVQVLNSSGTVLSTLHTYSNLDHNTGYAQHSFSLSGYAGQTITLKFTGSEDYELKTSFVIDDTALNVS